MEYIKEYEVHYFHCDVDLTASVYGIIRIFEDIAIQQSEDLGVGVEFYNKTRLGWMLVRWAVDIKSLPKFRDKIKVVTIPKAFKNFYANREYHVYDSTGNEIITAQTLWVFVTLDSRKPTKITQEMFDRYDPSRRDMETFTKLFEVKPLERIDVQKQFRVRMSDIDTNQHVNNSQYISWALETLSPQIRSQYRITKLNVNYLKETNLDDVVISKSQLDYSDDTLNCTTEVSCGETVVARVDSQWSVTAKEAD